MLVAEKPAKINPMQFAAYGYAQLVAEGQCVVEYSDKSARVTNMTMNADGSFDLDTIPNPDLVQQGLVDANSFNGHLFNSEREKEFSVTWAEGVVDWRERAEKAEATLRMYGLPDARSQEAYPERKRLREQYMKLHQDVWSRQQGSGYIRIPFSYIEFLESRLEMNAKAAASSPEKTSVTKEDLSQIWNKLTPAQQRELQHAWCMYHPNNSNNWRIADKRVMPVLLRLGLVQVKRESEDDNWPEWKITTKGFQVYLSAFPTEDQAKNEWMISTIEDEQ